MTKSTHHGRTIAATERGRAAERPADPAIGTDERARTDRAKSGSIPNRRRFERSLPMPAERHE